MPPATVLASSTRSQQPRRQREITSAKPAKPAASKTPAAPPPGSKSASCSPRAVAGIDPHARLAAATAVPPDGAWIELTPLHDASLRLDASGGRLRVKPVSEGSLAQRFRVHRRPIAGSNATSTTIAVELTASSTGAPLRVFRALPSNEVKLGSQLSMASAGDAQLVFTPALDSSSSGTSGPAAVRIVVRSATTDEPSHCLCAASSGDSSTGGVAAVPCDEIATPASQLWRWAAVPAPIAMPSDGSWISLCPATDANATLRADLSVSRKADGDATGSQRFRVQYVARGVPALGDRPQLRLLAVSSSSSSSSPSASTATSIGWCPSGGDDDDGPSITPAATNAANAATFAFESIDGETFRLLATSSTATDAAYCVAPGARVRVVPASAAAADSAWRWRPAEPWPPALRLPEDGQWITLTAASTTQEQQLRLDTSSNSDDSDGTHVVALRPCGDSTTATAAEGQKFRVHRWPLGPRTLIGLEESSGRFIVAAAGAQNEGAAALGSGLAMYDAHFAFTSHDGATFSIQAIHDPKRPVSLTSSTNEGDGDEMPSVGWSRSDALRWTWAPTSPPARRVTCVFPATGSIVELVPVQQDAKRLRASGKPSAPGVTVADASGSGGGKAAATALAAERWRVDRTVISGAETISLASTAVSSATRLGFTPAGKPTIGAKLQLSTAGDAAASFIVVPAPDGAGFRLTAQQEPGLALDVQSSGAVVLYKRTDTRMQQLWCLRVVTAA